MATVAQREQTLKTKAYKYKTRIKDAQVRFVRDLMNEPLDVPGVGTIFIQLSQSYSYLHAEPTIQVLDSFEKRLADGFNNNNILKTDAHGDFVDFNYDLDYHTHVTIRTREDVRRILDAWTIKRGNLETRTHLWGESYKNRIDKIEGVIPVTNSQGQPITGIASLVERERINTELNNEMIYDNAKTNMLATIIPSGLSDDVLEASQQVLEWLISIAQQKSNWVVNGIDEVYTPSQSATHEQENALKTIEVERQKGVRAIQRATTKTAIQTAYDTAKAAIDNVTVANAPIWKLDNGSTIPLTDGRHVIPYTEVGGSVTYRADNSVIDEEDAVNQGKVGIDKTNMPTPLRFTYQSASGSIASSYGVTVMYGGTKHPPNGDYDIELTARNACGPSLLKLRFVVPNFQPSFLRPSLPDKTLRVPTLGSADEIIQFDEATGGNGKLTYSILPILGVEGRNTYPRSREQYIRAGSPKAKETHTLTATDEDGDTATQTVAVTITR